jgi:hypothetical protein
MSNETEAVRISDMGWMLVWACVAVIALACVGAVVWN